MLLTLIKQRETRYGFHAVLIETNHLFGDKFLSEVYIPQDEMPLELIYRLTVTKSGIHLFGKKINWLWPNRLRRKAVFSYLSAIQSSREEIRLDVTSE